MLNSIKWLQFANTSYRKDILGKADQVIEVDEQKINNNKT